VKTKKRQRASSIRNTRPIPTPMPALAPMLRLLLLLLLLAVDWEGSMETVCVVTRARGEGDVVESMTFEMGDGV
jgi:hypothetical protein